MKNLFLIALTIFVVSCAEPNFDNETQIINKSNSDVLIEFDEDRLTSSEKLRLGFTKALGNETKCTIKKFNQIRSLKKIQPRL